MQLEGTIARYAFEFEGCRSGTGASCVERPGRPELCIFCLAGAHRDLHRQRQSLPDGSISYQSTILFVVGQGKNVGLGPRPRGCCRHERWDHSLDVADEVTREMLPSRPPDI